MRGRDNPVPVCLPANRGEWHLTEDERALIISLLEEVGSPGLRWLFVHDYDPRVQTTMQPYITFMRQSQEMKKGCRCDVNMQQWYSDCPIHGLSGRNCGEI